MNKVSIVMKSVFSFLVIIFVTTKLCVGQNYHEKALPRIKIALLSIMNIDSQSIVKLHISTENKIPFMISSTTSAVLAKDLRASDAKKSNDQLLYRQLVKAVSDSLIKMDYALNFQCKPATAYVRTSSDLPISDDTWIVFTSQNCDGHVFFNVINSKGVIFMNGQYEYYGEGIVFHFKFDCMGNIEYEYHGAIHYN
jgi:hypothetical protein